MDFGLSQDQETLQKYARDFLEKECPSGVVRKAMESEDGFDESLYKQLAELGWMGIHIPESMGGGGMGYVDVAVLAEELGRALLPGPWFATVGLGASVVSEAGSDAQKQEILSAVATGDKRLTLAYTESSGRQDAGAITTAARQDGGGWALSGTKCFVPDAHLAHEIVVAARTAESDDPEDGVTLFRVPADACQVTQLKTMDMTRRWCDVTLDGVKVGADAVLGEAGKGWLPLQKALWKAAALLCAESVGGAQKVLDMSVEYAKVRVQFGRPIGSFQAVKHRCADMLVDVEMSRSAMYYAAWAAGEDDPELALAASVAKAYCGDAYTRVAASGIQVHGGIGFTWEHDMHLYFKRAKANEMLLGDPTYHRELVARLVA